jgi:hypothetical protein
LKRVLGAHILEYVAAKNKVLVDVVNAGRLGGEARARNMSPEERKEAARAAVNARWEKYRAEKGRDREGQPGATRKPKKPDVA